MNTGINRYYTLKTYMQQNHRRAELVTLFAFIFILLSTCITILFNLVFIFPPYWKYLPNELFVGIFLAIIVILGLCFRLFEIWNKSKKGKKASHNADDIDEWRRKLIYEMKDNVRERLRQSLNHQKLLDLEFDYGSINNTTISTSSPSELQRDFWEIFKKHQTIILLGDPGAGKTTELLRLAKILITNLEDNIDNAKQRYNEPIPIIFELASWEPSQKIEQWLVERLKFKYKIPESIAKILIKRGQVLPLLDGLNEQNENSEKCLASIKAFTTQKREYPQQLLVCCRLAEFEQIKKHNKFAFLKPVKIKPLNREKIITYFEEAKRQDLSWLFESEQSLFEKVNLPLYLKILLEAYKWEEVNKYLQNNQKSQFRKVVEALLSGREVFLNKLLEDYIDHKLYEVKDTHKKKDNKYLLWFRKHIPKISNKAKTNTEKNTKQKLSWLAKSIIEHKQKEFLIENIQPTWLDKSHQKWLYRISFGIISGLILAIFSAFLSVLIYQLLSQAIASYIIIRLPNLNVSDYSEVARRINDDVINVIIGINSGLISGLISVVVYGEVNQVLFFEHFQLSWQRIVSFWCNIPRKIIFLIVLFISLSEIISVRVLENIYFSPENLKCFDICKIYPTLSQYFHVSTDAFCIILLITLFLSHIPLSIVTSETKNKTYPNQGIRSSLVNAVTITLINSLWMTFAYVSLCHFILNTESIRGQKIAFTELPTVNAVVFGLCCGFLLGFIFGGITVIQHIIIRLILWKSGSIPWNYAEFLADAAKRGFIIQIGGRYRFQHELLREYFAELTISQD